MEFHDEIFNTEFDEVGEFVTLPNSSLVELLAEASSVALPFHHRVIMSVFFASIVVIGIPGNLLVVASVFLSKKLQTATNILVVSLAMADFFTCNTLPYQMVMVLSHYNWPLPVNVCAAVVVVSYTTLCCSVLTLVSIAFVRWYVITKSIHGNQGLNTHRKTFIVAIVTWTFSSISMVVPPALGYGTMGMSEQYRVCSLTDDNPKDFYYIIFQGLIMVCSLFITAVFYVLILRFVIVSAKKFKLQFGESSADASGGKALSTTVIDKKSGHSTFNQREIDITKNLFTVVCIFVLCVLPHAVNFMIPGGGTSTMYTGMILTANSCLNPLIYGLKHPTFREVFRCILTWNLAEIQQPSRLLRRLTSTGLVRTPRQSKRTTATSVSVLTELTSHTGK
ncbi:nociceptin receptor-like [Diadema setosum]|uniref:nociceptin receptor-like n=1 Tax=Diadema setosum TaxID=31175 RepID=UPI003B3A3B27